MPFPQLRLYFDNAPADAERLALVSEIKVDQGLGMAAEAELTLPITINDSGEWASLTEDFAQPFKRVRVEVQIGDGDFVALIDGPIVAQRFDMHAEAGDSKMVLVVHDDSVLLNREEKVQVFESVDEQDVISQLFSAAALTPQVDTIAPSGTVLERAIVQRGTAMELLRALAQRYGMFVYVKPGPTPGQSIGVFAKPVLTVGELPELLMMGDKRNIDKFSAEFDALRPATIKTASITISDKTTQQGEASTSSLPPQDGDAVNSFLTDLPATRLSRSREEKNDVDTAAQAALDWASFAYSAKAEIDSLVYQAILSPYQVVKVAGVGPHLSGEYLISRVIHTINDSSYKQMFSLRRNARGKAAAAGGAGATGGVI